MSTFGGIIPEQSVENSMGIPAVLRPHAKASSLKVANAIPSWSWLARDRSLSTAQCGACGETKQKSDMLHIAGSGWFCDEAEYEDHWFGIQW
jgi:hypothetical protein